MPDEHRMNIGDLRRLLERVKDAPNSTSLRVAIVCNKLQEIKLFEIVDVRFLGVGTIGCTIDDYIPPEDLEPGEEMDYAMELTINHEDFWSVFKLK